MYTKYCTRELISPDHGTSLTMSADHNLPPGAGGQGAATRFNPPPFGQMNMNRNAQPFIPNAQAQPFVPMGGGGGGMQGYPYGGYHMHGE